MACLGLAWELGAASGYAAVMRQIALVAARQGHRCVVIARDLHVCVPAFADLPDVTLVQAPLATASRTPPVPIQSSYATLLHNRGFADADALGARLRAWLALFRAFGVERLLARHSPTAVLAARVMRLPVLHYGTGFSVPPPRTPWPGFRPELRLPDATLAHNEQRVLGITNAALRDAGAAPLETMAALYADLPTALISYPELDHYARPRAATWLGLPQTGYGEPPVWPVAPQRPRLFVSLLADASAREWIEVLAQLPVSALVRLSGHAARLPVLPPRLTVAPGAVHFAQAIAACDAVVGYGSHNLACEALLAGKPVALTARNPDQLMMAERVAALGAGIVLPERPAADSIERLRAFLADARHNRNAEAFAQRHVNPPRAHIAEALLRMALQASVPE